MCNFAAHRKVLHRTVSVYAEEVQCFRSARAGLDCIHSNVGKLANQTEHTETVLDSAKYESINLFTIIRIHVCLLGTLRNCSASSIDRL